MKKLSLLAALCVAAAFSSCSKHDNEINDVEPPVLPDEPTRELAITFVEGNSLQFDVDETKIVHYTITGGSDNNVVKAEMQNLDDAYTLKTMPASTTEGTIAITAKTPETENCVVVTVSDGSQTIMAAIAVSTKPAPEELAITFAEGNSLQFDINETKTVHYTITGGSDKTVVKAEMQTPDDAYTVKTTPTSTTEGTIAITAKIPLNDNCVIVTVSDGDQSITAEIAVALKPSFDDKTAVVVTPGTLAELLAGYDTTKIKELTVIGNLNDEDIAALIKLPNLAVLDMENANLEVLPYRAFYQKTRLTSVKLPKTLKTIGEQAFCHCTSLKSITIPDSVTSIGKEAFASCSNLTSITIPNSVTTIGEYAFSGCTGLTSITIPDSVTSIGGSAFYGCSLSAFYGKFASSDNRCLIINGTLNFYAPAGLTSYTIPDSVTKIGSKAFYLLIGLTSITIPDSVTEIGDQAFECCYSLTSVTIGNSVTSIGYSAFNRCESLTSVTIPDGVTSIGHTAFCGCYSLTSITIPDGVTSIGYNTFGGCKLTSITIPDSVTEILQRAFDNCSSLTSVTIGNSVTWIGDEAFQKCSGLKTIYCKAKTPPRVDTGYSFRGVFEDVNTSLISLYVPTGCKAAYAAADEWKKFTTIIETEF